MAKVKLGEQRVREFLIFTIYQNYTLVLKALFSNVLIL